MSRARLGLGVLAALAVACAGEPHRGVAGFGRPPGMPIGTGAAGNALEEEASEEPAQSEAVALALQKPEAAPEVAAAPCTGCVELSLLVTDINQRDEFALALDGSAVRRVVWTLLVNFNSDQLAVQPFIDGTLGKYTALHVNTFPLGEPVELEQTFDGDAQVIGLVVGSSGAWTGNQRMSLFVDAVRVEGEHPLSKSFTSGAEGLAPRTQRREPRVASHPAP